MRIKNKKEIFNELTKNYIELLDKSLVSIYVYGSSITPDFDPQTSDINVSLIVKDLKLDNIIPSKKLINKFKKKGVSTPLFLSEEYINRSLDSYPIEFLDIKSNNKLLYGKDIFSGIFLDPKHLRLQAERELKGKLLLLRLAFLENIQKKKYILPVIKKSIKSIIPILKSILKISHNEIPLTSAEIIEDIQIKLNINTYSLTRAWNFTRKKKIKLSNEDLVQFFQEYIAEVDKLSNFVDKLKVN